MNYRIFLISVLLTPMICAAQWEDKGHVRLKARNQIGQKLFTSTPTVQVKQEYYDTAYNSTYLPKGAVLECKSIVPGCLNSGDKSKCDCQNCVASYKYILDSDTCLFDTTITKRFRYFSAPITPYQKATIEKVNDTVFINPWTNGPLSAIPNAEFYLLLNNRQYYSLKYSKRIYLAPVVLPYRYRFPIQNKVNADFQKIDGAGFMPYGWSFGSMVVRYSKFENNKLYTRTLTVGPYLGFAAISMDSTNNSAIKKKQFPPNYPALVAGESVSVLALNLGASLFFNYNKLQLGFVFGLDHAMGPYSKNWKFQSNPWVAFGVGYNFDLLKIFNAKE